jgi:thiol-disulfide isomerase/thioredoxin
MTANAARVKRRLQFNFLSGAIYIKGTSLNWRSFFMHKLALILAMIAVFTVTSLSQADGPVKLTGQIVCSVCWFEATDRKKSPYGGAADLQCAAECAEEGVPQALAVESPAGFTLYILERGKYQPQTGSDFLADVAKTAEIEGTLRTANGKKIIRVDAIKIRDEITPKPIPVSNDAVLALQDMTGSYQSLAAYRGRVVVLNFWATWCEPCKKGDARPCGDPERLRGARRAGRRSGGR